jgi:natural product biosynthesis luciferase-like monooxygenase protein
MELGVMFFSSCQPEGAAGAYRLLIDAARLADDAGLVCVWTPERHFHAFGGLFPNPSLTSAALAMVTRRVQLRAGSLVSPLHDTLRIAEEWSVVDNLSGGRVAVSFGSGWNADDFVFFPERYPARRAVMFEQIESVRRLWRGESLCRTNSCGKEVALSLFPRPVQSELPVWTTSSGNPETFAGAGAIGANVLTHLIGQDRAALADKIRLYRAARASHGHDPRRGKVSLMLHTFLGVDARRVAETVREPFRRYLRSAVSLEQLAAEAGGAISGGTTIEPHPIEARLLEDLLDTSCERYLRTASLIGTPERCESFLWQLEEIGVDEVACLIDFIDDPEAVMGSLRLLGELASRVSGTVAARSAAARVDEFMEDL